MIWELVAAIIVGFVGWGVFTALRKKFPALPKWVAPVAAGLGIIGYTVFSEYSWFRGVEANLPPSAEVALTVKESKPYRPWTYIWPHVTRFIAVDHATQVEMGADQRRVDFYIMARWQPGGRVTAVFDCATPRRADYFQGWPEGQTDVPDADWIEITADDPIRAAVCRGESG